MRMFSLPAIPDHLRGRKYLKLGVIVRRISKRDGTAMDDAESFYTNGNGLEVEPDLEHFLSTLNHSKFRIEPVTFTQWFIT